MNKAKKYEDGNYYEKIVKWEERPDIIEIIIGMVVLILGVYGFIEGFIQGIYLYFLNSLSAIFSGIIIIYLGVGKGREVKFRRVGK